MLIHEMPMLAYREWDAVSASDLKNFRRSPAYARLRPSIESPALDWGTAVHTAVLEPHELEKRYGLDPESPKGGYPRGWRQTKDYAALSSEALAVPGTIGLLTRDQFAALQQIVDSVARNDIGKLLHELPGTRESSLIISDPEFGVTRKVRPDWLIPKARTIVDVKTAQDWRPAAFARSCLRYDYHLSDAYYRDTFALDGGLEIEHYVYLVISSDAPFEVASYTLDHDSVMQGRADYRKALAAWAYCKQTNDWPGGSAKIQEIRLPEYGINYYQDEEDSL